MYRVLFRDQDHDDQGWFVHVQAASREDAIWQAAQTAAAGSILVDVTELGQVEQVPAADPGPGG